MFYLNKRITNILIVIMVGVISCFLLFGCQNNKDSQSDIDSSENFTSGIYSVLSQIEIIDVKYKEVWNFEPYSKTYYIEPENWGMYGLEDSTRIASITGLDHMTFADDEQVVFLQTFDYQVCDYIEEIIYTITTDNEVQEYIIIMDREGTFIGATREQEEYFYVLGENKEEELKEYILEEIEEIGNKFFYYTYVPGYAISDLNEDGYIDLYRPSFPIVLYFGKDGGFERRPKEEALDWQWIDYCSQAELAEQERMSTFIEEHVSIKKIENRYVMYAQFHDISNAELINEQICKLAEENKDYYEHMRIDDVIYVGENYLVILMRTETLDGTYPTGEPSYDGSRYLTFDLNTGEMITFEDILCKDYTYDDMKSLMWKAYENKMNEVPDQYSKELFDEYYARVLKEYNEDLQIAEELLPEDKGNRNPILEDYAQCYFTDDGMVVVYGLSGRFVSVPPAKYYLNERLEIIETEENGEDREDVIEHFCSWEEIYDEAEG